MSTTELANAVALHQPVVRSHRSVLDLLRPGLRSLAGGWSGRRDLSRAVLGTTPGAEAPLEWRGISIGDGLVIDYLNATRGMA
jgi:hypothetical protein